MNICLYIANFIYKYGGTESYTSNLIEALQTAFPQAKQTVITEYYKNTKSFTPVELAERCSNAYGVLVDSKKISIEYIEISKRKSRFNYFLLQQKLIKITKKYDIFFYCSRGLLTGSAKKNIAVIHFPMDKKTTFPFYKKFPVFKFIAERTDRQYLKTYDCFLPNSHFTAEHLNKIWNIPEKKIKILYPPVTLVEKTISKEKNMILVCSRIEKSKKIEELISAWNSSAFLRENTKLIIAGSIKNESETYRKNLIKLGTSNKEEKEGGGVQFIFEPSRKEIESLYSRAFVFWHAKGFGETNPYFMEHFGITTVEAMSAGCIPVVIDKGGQSEIVEHGISGFKWNCSEELVSFTETIFSEQFDAEKMSFNAKARAKLFSKNTFIKDIKNLLSEDK